MTIYYPPGTGGTPVPSAGQYVFTTSPNQTGTSLALNVGTLRLAPWVVTRAIKLDRIGGDVATVGDAGSLFRLGIYGDNGSAYPGALVVDAGTIAGDSATVQDAPAISVSLAAGLYWIGGAVQAVTTTQPTIRVVSQWNPPVLISTATSQPSAAQSGYGYQQTGVTGALPANFSTSVALSGNAPRLHVRLA